MKIDNLVRAADLAPKAAKRLRSKYGAQPVTDPETGRRVASKREMKLLERLRREANSTGVVVAVQPRFVVEGGRAIFDAVEIIFGAHPTRYMPDPEGVNIDGWTRAWVRFHDAKGHDLPAGRKNRRQVRSRYGIEVRLE